MDDLIRRDVLELVALGLIFAIGFVLNLAGNGATPQARAGDAATNKGKRSLTDE